jgi:hypothetical protein
VGVLSSIIYSTAMGGTVTPGTGNTSFSWTQDSPQYGVGALTHHVSAEIHGTKNYDVLAFPEVVEGLTIVDPGTRIVLTKQLNGRENGLWRANAYDAGSHTWRLERTADWLEGRWLRAGTQHIIPVNGGSLWAPHELVLTVQSRMLIWSHGLTVGSWAMSVSVIPDHDVVDYVIAPGESFAHVPAGLSASRRASVRVSGLIYTGQTFTSGSTTEDNPLEVEPSNDESGHTWSGFGSFTRSTTTPHQGTYCWRLGNPASTTTTYSQTRTITVPANVKIRVLAWIRRTSSSHTTTIKLGTTQYGSELGSENASTSWSQKTLTAAADPVNPRTLYLTLDHSNSSGTTNQYSYLDAFQIDYVPEGPSISTLLYLDQSWSPNTSAPTLHEGDNTAGQLVDPSEFWGDDRMYVGSFDAVNGFSLAPLDIDRTLRVRLTPIHFGQSMAAPALPVVSWPANHYP